MAVDACVSVVLKRLAPSIEDGIRKEITLLLNANKEAQSLSQKLKKIHEVLADAERRGVEDTPVKSWLNKLQEIAYDIDDVLDEWELENMKQKLEESEEANNSHASDSWEKKVCSFLESVCLCFKQTLQRRTIALDIKGIHERLDSIAQENENEFKFTPNLPRADHSKEFKPHPTKSFVDVSKIHGRDDDRKTLVSKLLSESSTGQGHHDGVPIISIVGVGGMGKTAVAQLVFNDDRVKSRFKLKIWVCVSKPFNEIKIAKAILEDTDRASSSSLNEPQTLLKAIQKSISGQKFLLVLDDVWEDDDTKWESLKECLKSGDPGSRILVTTRNDKVARAMGSIYRHSLEPLSDSYCWSVLSQLAFRGRGEADREMLKEIGLEIAKKCKGLPLAAKTIGGLLCFKTTLQDWQDVQESKMWELEKVREDLFPLLTLSYNELNPAVRRCFSYCAIFPQDTLINVDKLIRMWMAQGFLSSSGSTRRELEQTGRDYFEDLAMRSFFQDFEKDHDEVDNRIVWCKMHDIVHDFAHFLTNDECLIVERVNGGAPIESAHNARHLNILLGKGTTDSNPFSISQIEKLRTCFCRTNGIPLNLFIGLKKVRSLSLHGCKLKDIPKEIGNLIRLRYLDLSNNPLNHLPETIYDLYYLETLDIEHCSSLGGLPPQGIHKLINLRHLINYGVSDLRFPQGFDKLTNLRTLNSFSVKGGNKLGCLKDLNKLGGNIRIQIDGNVDEMEAKEANLGSKKFIVKLILDVSRARIQVIEALQPHRNLQILYYQGQHLPKWIVALVNLRRLTLDNGIIEKSGVASYSWPPLGKLPLLEYLDVYNSAMTHVGYDFLGIMNASSSSSSGGSSSSIFPKLKTLIFRECWWWEEWEDISEEQENDTSISILARLKQLQFRGCQKLKVLPHRLLNKASSLQHLSVERCGLLKSRYNKETGPDSIKLSHIPRVEFIMGGKRRLLGF
ncbi:putative disease resistance protein RGA1 [Sesamum alatum]|uniref:Disease resistance protein RGA1 n=1 Tax=Sesamum alatum TaxID=300844 RepID=A0AAE1YA19_9LAMI|nr:putative disease resistance protein RGA1 [Sesamum alatum]